jgi:predicted dehydrogenase (TIGR03970 family)
VIDVLIVGAGSAGSVLAERLSADPARQVTVLEAGPSRGDPAIRALTDDAAILPIGPDSPVVRRYRTTLTGMHAAEIVRGWCVGGSGAVNGGYFCRALPEDFDQLCLPGWSWADVESHYRAVERRIPTRVQHDFASSTAAFIAAAEAAGFPRLPGLAAGSGIAEVPLNIADGVRVGPGAAFLEPALSRPNLTLRSGIRVVRLVIAGDRVTGVEALGAAGPFRIPARRVVLSAGAVASAQLLMLSGIGSAADLLAQGIEVAADLPVGQSFQDHPEWLVPTDWAAMDGHPVLEAVLVTDDLEIRPYTTGFGVPRTAVGVALMRPRSRGRMALAAADPTVAPRIEHRYDGEPDDVADLRRGCDLVAGMLVGATELGAPSWSTSQHLCGTAPMGVDTDPRAVTDPHCRVRGIDGLWVVDGSVLPRIPSRGPHATIAMLAHRAAEFFI